MAKRASSLAKPSKSRKSKAPIDRVAAEWAEIRARKIPAKNLMWIFRFTTPSEARRREALAACVEFLASELGNRCRVQLDTGRADRRQIQDIMLKSSRLSPDLLCKLDRALKECCRRMKVSYGSVSYAEEIYKQTSWKTLGTALQPEESPADSEGDLDCRELRFDGLYRDSSAPPTYLRFYPDGAFAATATDDTPRDVARWLRRGRRWISVGKYTVSGSTLTGEYHVPPLPGDEPTVIKLKGRLTRKGLQVRSWSSYSRKESREVYVFHELGLK